MNLIGKLMKLDSEVMDLERVLALEEEREVEEGIRLFKASRAIRHKLERLKQRRAALRRIYTAAPNREVSFLVELSRRKVALEDARGHLVELEQELVGYVARRGISPADKELGNMIKAKLRQIESQRIRVRNKDRALDNWRIKGLALECKESAKPALQRGSCEAPLAARVLVNTSTSQVEREAPRASRVLLDTPLVTREARAENNASLDLLSGGSAPEGEVENV